MIEINIDPVAFSIGLIEIRWYGIMIALGVTALVLWTMRQVRKGANLTYETVLTGALVGIPAGVIFSRLLHVIDRWDYYVRNPGQIIGGEGLTIYGAVLGAALAVWIYSRFSNFKFVYAVDLLAPGIVLAQAIGRVGCLINGCCYGEATSLPWAIAYTHPNSPSFGVSGVHPTQVYEIIFLMLMFGVLLILKDRLKPEGSLFLVYLGGYSLWRFGVGFIREGTPFLFGLHQAQVIGILIAVIAVILLVRQRAHLIKKEKDSDMAENIEEVENG
ncbi:MAG: prolipoprotein diacylglyceryl transferase [Dehalococcoidales bacterium]|nr:prolipoprotein diacylglyceryl transferase [Dehalococcoidales bacterium]